MVRLDPGVELFHFGGRRAQLKDFAPWMRSAVDPRRREGPRRPSSPSSSADESLAARIMIVIEDVPQFADSPAERPLKALFQAVNRSEHLLIGDADVGAGHERLRAHRRLQGRPDGHRAARRTRSTATRCSRCRSRRSSAPTSPRGAASSCRPGAIVTVQLPLVDSPVLVMPEGAPARDDSGARALPAVPEPAERVGNCPHHSFAGCRLRWSGRPGRGRIF